MPKGLGSGGVPQPGRLGQRFGDPPPPYNYGLGAWVCSLGPDPPALLILVAWVGGRNAIFEKNFTVQSLHGP